MQSVNHPIQHDTNSSTIRRYSLVAEASQRRDQKFAEWTAAFHAYTANPNTFTLAALEFACDEHKQAERDLMSVHIPAKYNRGTVDGSNNSMTGSLRDAGFCDSGVM